MQDRIGIWLIQDNVTGRMLLRVDDLLHSENALASAVAKTVVCEYFPVFNVTYLSCLDVAEITEVLLQGVGGHKLGGAIHVGRGRYKSSIGFIGFRGWEL